MPHDVVIRSKKLPPIEKAAYLKEWEKIIGGPIRPDWDGMMSWRDLQALRAEGYEIGSHSMAHSILPLCTDQELVREIVDSRTSLEQQLGPGIESFCYPNGDHEARTVRVVAEAGYTRAVTTKWGLNDGRSPPFELRRCDMQGQHARSARGKLSDARLAFRMSGFHPGLG